MVFPGLWLYPTRWLLSPQAPPQTTRHLVSSADGNSIEVLEMRPEKNERPFAAVLFHGNGGGASGFVPFQHWLASLGIPSYQMEYRGYGHTSGWPSERKIYQDAEAVWRFVTAREKRAPEQMIVMGQSIGSGFAAYLAAARKPRLLILLSGYSSLREAGADRPFVGFLAPLMWYEVPAAEYLSALENTCVISAHGKRDTVIPFFHQARLRRAYHGRCGWTEIVSAQAGHNDLFIREKDRMMVEAERILGKDINEFN